ncbi:MAG TPA: hypothetical protein DDZ51_03595 [Planctomycetaceae bacterium]|nr:hypothetical protein [Planctomycetaceae bacterium]
MVDSTIYDALPTCLLVWHEAEVGLLDASRNLSDVANLTWARRLNRRAQVEFVGQGGASASSL